MYAAQYVYVWSTDVSLYLSAGCGRVVVRTAQPQLESVSGCVGSGCQSSISG